MGFEDKFGIDNTLQSIALLKKEVDSASDRSCAIVCAAFLDDYLGKLILSFLTEESSTQDRRLTENNGPLSTFSAKIVMAYRLGLIAKKEYDSLTIVRKIRNYFAHNIETSSFDDAKIKSILLENIPDEKLLPPISIPLSLDYDGKPLDIPINFFIEIIKDEEEYSAIVDKFPKIEFRELDKTSARSIFLCIVYILQACLCSRLLIAMLNRRKQLDDFKDMVEIERYKLDYLENFCKGQIVNLQEMKAELEEQLAELEKMTNSSKDNSLKNMKNKILEELLSVNQLISKLKDPLSIEHATQIHTYRLLKYQLSKRGVLNNLD